MNIMPGSHRNREALFFLTTVILVCLIYVPHMGTAYRGMDESSYSQVLRARDFWKTSWHLVVDYKGEVVPGYYAPLGSISLMADTRLAGSRGAAPRFTVACNILLHCLNGILLWILLRSLGMGSVTSWAAATIFLIHPMQVPVVFWFAERKTLMAFVFYLLAYTAFIRSRRMSSGLWYGTALTAFFAGLLCKPTVTMLPVCLVVTELLGLIRGPAQPPSSVSQSFLRRLAPTAPFFVMALLSGLLAISSEGVPAEDVPLFSRPLIAAKALWFYVWKILIPVDTTFVYPRWQVDPASLIWWVPLAALVAAGAVIFRFRERLGSHVIWGLANFVIPLIPAIGLLRFGYLRHSFVADHFAYTSIAGLATVMAILWKGLIDRVPGRLTYAGILAGIVYLAFLGAESWHRAAVWETPVSLWTENVRKNPESWSVRYGLGTALLDAGNTPAAVEHLTRAIELNPQYDIACNNLGEAMLRQGRIEEAIELFRRAIKLNPNLGGASNNLGNAFMAQGKLLEAIEAYQKAIEVAPTQAQAHNNLGAAYMRLNRIEDAIRSFRKATGLDPDFAKARANLGFALLAAGKPEEAKQHLEAALNVNPGLAEAHNSLGIIYTRTGDFPRAVNHLKAALDLRPDWPEAKRNLAIALENSQGTPGRDDQPEK